MTFWQTADLDYYITASFPRDEYDRHRLHVPGRLIAVVEARLRDARYFGPFVSVYRSRGLKRLLGARLPAKDVR